MNWEYVKTFLTQASFSSQQDVVVKGKISKDVANAVTVLYHGNVTPPSVDLSFGGKQRTIPSGISTNHV
jgi:hypothetical protein